MRFSLPSIKCSAGPPSLRLLPNSVRCLNSAQRFDHRALGSSRKLGGAGEHLIDGSEKRIVTEVGGFVNLGVLFLCGSMVANPIISYLALHGLESGMFWDNAL